MASQARRIESHGGLGSGMVHDDPRTLIRNGFFDSRDTLVDKPGVVRKRGGTRPIMGVAETIVPQHIAVYASADNDLMRAIYVAYGETDYASPTIAAAPIGGAGFADRDLTNNARIGRPFRYGQVLCFPQIIPGVDTPPVAAVAGSTFRRTDNAETLTHASMACTTGSHIVSILPAEAEKAQPGRFIYFNDGGNAHFDRIVGRNAACTEIYLGSPVPFTDAALNGATVADVNTAAADVIAGAKVGCSFQNRVILGGVAKKITGVTTPSFHPERIVWSHLPGEIVSTTFSGLTQITGAGYGADDYLDLPQLGEVVALAPAGPNELLVFGPSRVERINGTLLTLDADVSTEAISEVSAQPLSTTVGCMSERTVQETPYGIVWASQDGVWLYRGGAPTNLMSRAIQSFWSELQTRDGFEVYGSALVRGDHYVISTSDACLMCYLPSAMSGASGWTRLRDDLTITGSMADPRDPSVVYASTYTSPVGGEPDPASNRVFRLDTILDPQPDNTLDHDGEPVEAYLETRAYDMGDAARLKRLRRMLAAVDLKNSADAVDGNLAGLNADAQGKLSLPNLDAEHGTTDHWRATGATASTVTREATIKRSGSFSIKCVTGATGGGVTYDLPGGYGDSATILSVEAWVRMSTAGTLTMDVGGSTATHAVTGTSFSRMTVSELPSPTGVLTGYSLAFTHSASGATFYVDDVTVSLLQPWITISSGNNLVTGASAWVFTGDGPLGYDQCIKVTTLAASANSGISHKTLGIPVKKNQTYTAKVWLKADSGTQDYTIFCGAGAAATNGNTIVTATTEWKQVSVDFTAASDQTDLYFSIRKADTGSATFYIAGLQITSEDAEVEVAVIGGLEAEGDYGDGTCEDQDFASLSTDYQDLLNPASVTVTDGQIVPTSTSAKAFAYRRGFAKTRGGEATVSYTPGHADDVIGCLITVLDANNYLCFEPKGGGVSRIRKFVGGTFTDLATGSPATITLGVRYWLRAVRRGRLLTLEHWTQDPALGGDVDPLVEHYLSSADATIFADKGLMGFRFTPGDTAMRIDSFRCEPYSNAAIIESDPSAPVGARGDVQLLTRAATVCFRQYGAASECEFGALDLHFNPLNPSRTS